MTSVFATYRHGTVELAVPVSWPDGTPVRVVPIENEMPAGVPASSAPASESYAEFMSRVIRDFGPEPFERPLQGEFEQREDW